VSKFLRSFPVQKRSGPIRFASTEKLFKKTLDPSEHSPLGEGLEIVCHSCLGLSKIPSLRFIVFPPFSFQGLSNVNPKKPVLACRQAETGMKDGSAEGRKKQTKC
jgi:hypothetical protein